MTGWSHILSPKLKSTASGLISTENQCIRVLNCNLIWWWWEEWGGKAETHYSPHAHLQKRPSGLWPCNKCLELGHSRPLWWENALNGLPGLWGRNLVEGIKAVFRGAELRMFVGARSDVLITISHKKHTYITDSYCISCTNYLKFTNFGWCMFVSLNLGQTNLNKSQFNIIAHMHLYIRFVIHNLLLKYKYEPLFSNTFCLFSGQKGPGRMCVSKGYAISPPRWDSTDL